MTDLLRVMLVEDNPGDADLIVELLPRNYEVVFSARLSEALERIGTERFDILLLDLGLPDSSGLATLRTMLLHAVESPIIVMTGNNDERMGLDAIREGAQDYLIKGQIDKNLLARSIKYAVERKQAENVLKQLNATLEKRIAERTAQLTSANETLQTEIAEHRHAVEGLQLAKEEWERTFASVPDLIMILDNRHRVLRVNESMARRLKCQSEECVGLACHEVVHGTSVPPEFCPHSRTIHDGLEHTEELHVARFGGNFQVTTTPLLDEKGERIGSVHIGHDITERKQMEDSLRKSEEQFRTFFEQSLDAVFLGEIDGSIIEANPAASKMFGLTRQEFCRVGRAGIIDPNDVRLGPALEERTLTGRTITEMTCIRKNGERFPAEVSSVIMPENTQRAFIIIRDITERKQAEQVLIKFNEDLENRVKERTAELRDKDQLLLIQSRQAAMGEMIGNIAHQWRQPLNTLGLIVQQLPLFYDMGEFTKEFLDSSVLKSMNLIKHMSKTIEDFTNYFKPDKEMVEFKVSAVIKDTLFFIEDSFISQRIRVEVITKHDPAINGYPNEYSQVLLNILNNARDALIEKKIDDPRVTISIYTEGDRAVVTISDNAGGIPEEIMEKIFDPYFTTKGPQTGTGVGLFMSKAIIEKNMGGRLAAFNIANGAEFRIEV